LKLPGFSLQLPDLIPEISFAKSPHVYPAGALPVSSFLFKRVFFLMITIISLWFCSLSKLIRAGHSTVVFDAAAAAAAATHRKSREKKHS